MKSRPTKLAIEIREYGQILLSTNPYKLNAAQTFTRFVEKIYDKSGHLVLEKLMDYSTGRGPLVSQDPELDFVNPKQGTVYKYKPISDSGFYLLTHSSTKEKVKCIEYICQLQILNLSEPVIFYDRKNDLIKVRIEFAPANTPAIYHEN